MASTYLDRLEGIETSVAVKAPVRVATTANIVLSGEQTVDGVALVGGDRVLVKDQASAIDNGTLLASQSRICVSAASPILLAGRRNISSHRNRSAPSADSKR